MGVTVERIGDPDRWREVRDEWDRVVLSSARPSIYTTWDFLDASWTHFAAPAGDRLSASVVRDGGRAIGVAGWRLARRWPSLVGLRRLCTLGSWESDSPAPAFESGRESECAAAMLQDLEARGAEWDVLDWGWAPVEHAFTQALRAWARSSDACRPIEHERPPSAVVELPESWEEYLAQLSRNERKKLRRQLKRFEGPDDWVHEIKESVEDMPRALADYLAIERRSWKPAHRQGIGRRPQIAAFYRDLLIRCARQGRVSVHFLEIGGERVAGEVSLRLGAAVWSQQIAFDERRSDLGPGSVLTGVVLHREIERGTARYELMALFPESKKRWIPVFHDNMRLGIRQVGGLRRRLFAVVGAIRAVVGARQRDEARLPNSVE